MKICPYCSSQIPDNKTLCPHCGKEYWLPEIQADKGSEEIPEEEHGGCLQVILTPLIIAALSIAFLVSCGIIINLFANFESNQVKIAWLLGSVSVGLAVYFLLSKKKRRPRK